MARQNDIVTHVCVLILFVTTCGPWQKADLVLHGGTIYTVNDSIPVVNAVAVIGDTIVFTGSNEDVDDWIGEKTVVLDLKGLTATPGFIVTQGNLIKTGYEVLQLDLSQVGNFKELIEKVRDAASVTPPGEWIIGRRWDESKWYPALENPVRGYPKHNALSQVSPENPVWLMHDNELMGITNAMGLSMAGISSTTFFDGRGIIIKDRNGFPTGVFTYKAMQMIQQHIPSVDSNIEGSSDIMHGVALDMTVKTSIENGVTGFQDITRSMTLIDLSKDALNRGKLNFRISFLINKSDRDKVDYIFSGEPSLSPDNRYISIEDAEDEVDWQNTTGDSLTDGTSVKNLSAIMMLQHYASLHNADEFPADSTAYSGEKTRASALRHFTVDALGNGYESQIRGTIDGGKLADIAVFSQDIMNVSTEDLPKTEVIYTIIGGRIAYRRR